ncbi:hypothetical protein DPMN_051733 [Dreissena polymorpha]|uniref:Uncharacterized protein n=1 Tax=Dreissena polymorpha TaxID=45954 RepID=A0A9D4CID4_DREPO|nr:hypothetical protein DPMN_051733 [Dreissena polymorpha]
MGKVTHDIKLKIIALFKSGINVKVIVKELELTGVVVLRQIVSYWIKQYVHGQLNTDEVIPKPKAFRSVSYCDLEIVKSSLQRNCHQSSTDIHRELKEDGATFSLSTTRRLIKAARFTNSNPRYLQMVNTRNLQPRIDFCQTLIESNNSLDNIIFTDESSVQLHNNRTKSYRPEGSARTSIPKPKHPLKVHVWAGISRRGPTSILIFDGIMDSQFFTEEILEKTLLLFVRSQLTQMDISFSKTTIRSTDSTCQNDSWKRMELIGGMCGRPVRIICVYML